MENEHQARELNNIQNFIRDPKKRQAQLTIEEYERDFRRTANDLQLVERVFYGGMASNELRAALWPYLFGLVKHRGKFKRQARGSGEGGGPNEIHQSNHVNLKQQQQYQMHNGSKHLDSQKRTDNTLANNNNNYNGNTNSNKNHQNYKINGNCSNGTRTANGCNGTNSGNTNGTCNGTNSSNGNYSSNQNAYWLGKQIQAHKYVYIEHEKNIERWKELEQLYYTYESQWRSIMPDQELRFSTFRERKALIERDVVRSDRSHPFYADNSTNLTKFTTLLMTYMMYDFDIGYLQGMSDLAAPILYVFDGDLVKSFWVFVEVMKLFRRNFEYSQKTIHFQLNCLYRLIKLTDSKFAYYLSKNECSNCFFAFRSIVCQFKREIMRNNDNCGKENEQAASSSESLDENDENIPPADDDYARVLNLWDTIWCVQRRHELLSKSKCVHTFTIASGKARRQNMFPLPSDHLARQHHHQLHNHHNNHCHSKTNGHQKTLKSQQHISHNSKTTHNMLESSKTHSHGTATTTIKSSSKPFTNNEHHLTQGRFHQGSNNHLNHAKQQQNGTKQSYLSNLATIHRQQSISSLRSYGSENGGSPRGKSLTSRSLTTTNGCMYNEPILIKNGSSDQLSISSSVSINGVSLNGSDQVTSCSLNSCHSCSKKTSPVKHEQIVYTKETFYSSFDPNQADVPRYELTETEKFVLSLCLSLIKRERNYILMARMEASEIHQYFVKPRLAGDLTSFIDQAYEIYEFLNTDCDLQRLVKGANEPNDVGVADFSPTNGIDIQSDAWNKEPDTADTYDLLKDYLIISPTSYDNSTSPHGKNLIGSINYVNRSKQNAMRCV